MKSMLERERNFTPVSTSIVDRHVLARGSQQKVVNQIKCRDELEKPDLIILTPTCTSSILQEDLKNFVDRATIESRADVLLADVNHYRVNELQAADKTLLQIVKFYMDFFQSSNCLIRDKTSYPSVNIIGSVSLGFHNQHDLAELKRLFYDLGIEINLVIPENLSVKELCKVLKAWFNFVPYREIGRLTAQYLQDKFAIPFVDIVPIGTQQIKDSIMSIQEIILRQGFQVDYSVYIDRQTRFIAQSSWFSRSIDCQNLIGKKAVVFGDASHSSSITRILACEMGIKVIWSGTYCTNEADWFKKEVNSYCDQVVVTDDYTIVADLITKVEPDAIFGTQMERHIGKRLSIPCGVISSPVHIQNFPLSYRPFVGYEGTNQISDLIYNSFTLGMEDHLLDLFGGHDTKYVDNQISSTRDRILWSKDALEELNKIPSFVRKKVKKNTEKFAQTKNIQEISLEFMYLAKQSIRF